MSSLSPSQEREPNSQLERTDDSMFRGRVRLQQHKKGYRFSLDPVLLAHFTARLAPQKTLDLGTGCGVIPLLLAALWQHQEVPLPDIQALEIQPSLAALARDNILSNQMEETITIRQVDLRDKQEEEHRQWQIVTCNPPYFPAGTGAISPHIEKATARHECNGSLEEIVKAAAYYLHNKGVLTMIYPSRGLTRMMRAIQRSQLHLTRLQWIHPTVKTPARLVLVMARFRATPLQVEPPLFLYKERGNRSYTAEMNALLDGFPLAPFG